MAENLHPTAQPHPRTPLHRHSPGSLFLHPRPAPGGCLCRCRPELGSRLAVGHPQGLALTPARTTPHSHSREQVVISREQIVIAKPGKGRDHQAPGPRSPHWSAQDQPSSRSKSRSTQSYPLISRTRSVNERRTVLRLGRTGYTHAVRDPATCGSWWENVPVIYAQGGSSARRTSH